MGVDEDVVERIVGEVMGQLATDSASMHTDTDNQRVDRYESPSDGIQKELHFSEKIVTAELLQTQLNGEMRISLEANSILTPSARDHLVSQKIQWCRKPAREASKFGASCYLAITIQSTSDTTTALDEIERSDGTKWRREIVGQLTEAVEMAVSTLCRADADGVVVFSEQAESIACRSNRNKSVRAAVVEDVASVQYVKRTMDANLLAIKPAGKGYFALRNMLRSFMKDGPAKVPSDCGEEHS